jgi:hypothetical protein
LRKIVGKVARCFEGIFTFAATGELAEWSIVADSKSVVPFGVPGVRIPRSPLKLNESRKTNCFAGFFLDKHKGLQE